MIDARHDLRFMAAALAVGRRNEGCTAPNPAVGAVLVREGPAGPVIVGAGVSAPGGRPHAEPLAVAEAGPLARGATCYATLEPCSHFGKTPPCADALIAAGVAGVVTAIADPNPAVAGEGFSRLRAAGIEVRLGVQLEEPAVGALMVTLAALFSVVGASGALLLAVLWVSAAYGDWAPWQVWVVPVLALFVAGPYSVWLASRRGRIWFRRREASVRGALAGGAWVAAAAAFLAFMALMLSL